jgi:hypothetical protein
MMKPIAALAAALLLGCIAYPTAPETANVEVPAGLTEADVLVKMGAPAYVTQKQDGGKLMVYEETSTTQTSSASIPITPAGCRTICSTKTGKCTSSGCDPMYVNTPGKTYTSKVITVFDVGADGKVLAIRVTG